MTRRRIYSWLVLFIGFVFVLSANDVYAQKKKKTKSDNGIPERTVRQSEYFFIEAQKYLLLEDYAKALSLFQETVEITPNNSAAYYKLAEIFVHNENIGEAQKHALKALELDGENKYYYLLIANIFTEKGEFDKASEYYELMISHVEGVDDYLFELAALYLYQNRLDDALSTYNKAEEVFGVNEQIVFQKQKILLQLNQLEAVIQEGEKLIKAYPDEPVYVIALVDILVPNNRIDAAIEKLQKLLEEYPENGRAKLILSDIYKNKGELKRSEELLFSAFNDPNVNPDVKVQIIASYTQQISKAREINNPNATLEDNTLKLSEKIIELHPNEGNAYGVYGDLLYALNKKTQALDSYLQTVSLNPDNFQVWQNIFQLDTELGKLEASLEHLERAMELFPNQSVIYMYYGLALTQKQNFNEAIVILNQGRQLSLSNQFQTGVFYSLLGNAYNAIKDFENSDQSYENALEINPNDYQTLNNFSYFLSLRQDKLDKAEKMAQKVVRDNPENSTYADTYAWVLYTKGKYKEAKKQLDKVMERNDISAIHFDHYGDILYKLGNVQGAVEYWLRAKGMNPDIDNIDKKIANRKVYE